MAELPGRISVALPSKSVLTSKTCWANLLMASVAEVLPGAGSWIATHPQTAILLCAVGNIVLRHLSIQPLHWRQS